jgi:hypothetical protein
MVPGRWLHRVASRWLSASTHERIFEPLLADFQHQWVTAPDRRSRMSTLVRGYVAFWQAAALCGARTVAMAPSRITLEKAVIGLYASAIVLVILFGFTWVRTGNLDPAAGWVAIRKLTAVFGPGFLLGRSWPKAIDGRGKTLVLLSFSGAIGIACWINGGSRLFVTLCNFLYFGFFARQRMWKKA